MTKEQYGITKATPSLPARDLLRVPHQGKILVVSSPAFGPGTYENNVKEMQKQYSHSAESPQITFRPATTSESISAAAYKFGKMAKPQIFDPRWLQTGYIVRTPEGVFTNTQETDEKILNKMLNKVEKVNGIYLIDDRIAFAPYESFRTGVQDSGDFAEGGLAKALEHTTEKSAPNLREISSSKFYKRGVNVWGYDKVNEPIVRVASLDSDWSIDGDGLDVGGCSWGDVDGGYGFGVRDAEGDAQNPKNC